MGWFGKSKFGKAVKGAAREVSKDLVGNKDYLEACCAAASLMAAAEGGASPAEKQTAIQVVSQNPTLGALYDRNAIEQCMTTMISRADSSSGRFSLEQEMGDILKLEKGVEMAVYVALIAKDIMDSDGTAGDKERAVFSRICKRLNVDAGQFE